MPAIDLSPPTRPIFLSPHLDDAVFSCGRLLASLQEPVVATVFAGSPPSGTPLTAWDRAGGFGPKDDVVAKRREEDRQALSVLGARPWWLPLTDCQYGASPTIGEVAAELYRLFERCEPDAIFFPLGLFHDDHRLVRNAVLLLLVEHPSGRWYAYEDALYRRLPGEREAGLLALRQTGCAISPAHFPETTHAEAKKRVAISRYHSQLQALVTPGRPGIADLDAPEAYWAVRYSRGG
jgi:LmbE family N-acetylglucosaminyl deacetylase